MNVCVYVSPNDRQLKRLTLLQIQPHTYLADVMSQIRYTATPEQLLEEVDYCFLDVSGLPVVDEKSKCIGVVSKRDRVKASKGVICDGTLKLPLYCRENICFVSFHGLHMRCFIWPGLIIFHSAHHACLHLDSKNLKMCHKVLEYFETSSSAFVLALKTYP